MYDDRKRRFQVSGFRFQVSGFRFQEKDRGREPTVNTITD
jgi:hypothetical protein